MKLGEIKLESLRLMNANDEDLNIVNLDNYRQDDRYKDYLDRMPGAINRAISRFMTYKVISTKTVEVKPSQGETLKQFLKLNLKTILSDFGSLERIMYIYERVVPNIEFQTITDGVVLIPFSSSYVFKGSANAFPESANAGDAYNVNGVCKYWNGNEWENVVEEESFSIEYTPIVPLITVSSDDNLKIDIPETLARIIPYYVKADLYEQDEPELAATARNIFESALTEYVSFGITRKQRQQYVKNTML
jgi:hypothetical protein